MCVCSPANHTLPVAPVVLGFKGVPNAERSLPVQAVVWYEYDPHDQGSFHQRVT